MKTISPDRSYFDYCEKERLGLKTYQKNSKCIKCGNTEEILSSWHTGKKPIIEECQLRVSIYDDFKEISKREHICRKCSRCGYVWPEAIIDETQEES